MKKNLFMFLAGVVTCLSVISVSGFIFSPAKTESKPSLLASAPQTPKPNNCDCPEFITSVAGFGTKAMFTQNSLSIFTVEYFRFLEINNQEPLRKKCFIIRAR